MPSAEHSETIKFTESTEITILKAIEYVDVHFNSLVVSYKLVFENDIQSLTLTLSFT